MTTYNVHIYRVMRLVFGGIEADSHEAAASIARDKPTDQADSIDDCDGETLAALVDVHGDEEYEQSRIIDFEPERQRRAARKMLAALKDLLGDRPSVQDFQCIRCGRDYHDIDEWAIETGECPSDDCPSYHARAAIAEAEAAGITPAPGGVGLKHYSVLLLYPDWANDGGTETYYAFVEAPDPIAAVAEAQRQAATTQIVEIDDPTDFAPLLVTVGHHYGQPMSNE